MNVLHQVCMQGDTETLDWLINVCLKPEDSFRLLQDMTGLD